MSSHEASEVQVASAALATTVTSGVSKTVIETSETTTTTFKTDTPSSPTTVVQTTVKALPAETTVVTAPATITITELTSSSDVVSASEKTVTSKATPKAAAPAKASTASTPAKKATANAAGKPAAANSSATKAAPKAAAPKTAASATGAKSAQTKQAPPGYKLIKVKNAAGEIIIVKKKLTPEEIAEAERKGEKADADDEQRFALKRAKTVAYKIVSVPQPDGTLVKVRRPIISDDAADTPAVKKPAVKKPAAAATAATTSKGMTSKDTKETKSTKDIKAAVVAVEELDPAKVEEMIKTQKHRYRMGRRKKFGRSLFRGFAKNIIGDLGSVEVDSHGMQEGDEIVSDDDSDLDYDSDDDNHSIGSEKQGDLHDSDSGHNSHDVDGDEKNVSGSGHGVKINTKAVAENVINAATAPKTKKKTETAKEPADPEKTADASEKPKSTVTYKVTEKDKEDLDEEKPVSTLRRHWENFSFYFLASLSVVLPAIFFLLAIGIALMKNKEVGSRWDNVKNAIEVAVSAWPIIFAAVVAQTFKTFATYKVERGIKLLQLEQLVGSNSFASAAKQPLLLRRFDTYALLIFVAWCLSPIGSQALERVWGRDWVQQTKPTTIWYLNRNEINPLFTYYGDDYEQDSYRDGNDYVSHVQQAALFFQDIFLPDPGMAGSKKNYGQDSWNNPQTRSLNWDNLSYNYFANTQGYVSIFGIPFYLTDSFLFQSVYLGNNQVVDWTSTSIEESFIFPVNTSYFDFECGPWSTLNSDETNATIFKYGLQYPDVDSPTFYMGFGYENEKTNETSTPDMLRFASFNWKDDRNAIEDLDSITNGVLQFSNSSSNATFSYIECPMKQRYVYFNVNCSWTMADSTDGTGITCNVTDPIGHEGSSPGPGTQFRDFTEEFMSALTPISFSDVTITPFERYLASQGDRIDYLFNFNGGVWDDSEKVNTTNSTQNWYKMSELVDSTDFGNIFSYVFNSWLDTGYCPGYCRTSDPTDLLWITANMSNYVNYYNTSSNGSAYLNGDLNLPESMFTPSKGIWTYTSKYVYTVDNAYLVLFFICSACLLILGIGSVVIEAHVVAPDVLGYASTVARNSRYLHLPVTNPGMSGADRLRRVGGTMVMMQDVKKDDPVGKIALGLKKDDSERLRLDRPYR